MSERTGGGTGWFFFQRVSAVLLAILLLAHFALMHFAGAELTQAAVAARLASNLYRAVDLSFLGLALAHGLYGVWVIAGDYLHRPWLRLAALIACGVAGLFLSVLGALTIIGG